MINTNDRRDSAEKAIKAIFAQSSRQSLADWQGKQPPYQPPEPPPGRNLAQTNAEALRRLASIATAPPNLGAPQRRRTTVRMLQIADAVGYYVRHNANTITSAIVFADTVIQLHRWRSDPRRLVIHAPPYEWLLDRIGTQTDVSHATLAKPGNWTPATRLTAPAARELAYGLPARHEYAAVFASLIDIGAAWLPRATLGDTMTRDTCMSALAESVTRRPTPPVTPRLSFTPPARTALEHVAIAAAMGISLPDDPDRDAAMRDVRDTLAGTPVDPDAEARLIAGIADDANRQFSRNSQLIAAKEAISEARAYPYPYPYHDALDAIARIGDDASPSGDIHQISLTLIEAHLRLNSLHNELVKLSVSLSYPGHADDASPTARAIADALAAHYDALPTTDRHPIGYTVALAGVRGALASVAAQMQRLEPAINTLADTPETRDAFYYAMRTLYGVASTGFWAAVHARRPLVSINGDNLVYVDSRNTLSAHSVLRLIAARAATVNQDMATEASVLLERIAPYEPDDMPRLAAYSIFVTTRGAVKLNIGCHSAPIAELLRLCRVIVERQERERAGTQASEVTA